MRVVCPYTKIIPIVRAVIDRETSGNASYFEMKETDSYWKLMADIWSYGEGVILIEHDILPWPGALGELAACPEPWCTFSYHMKGGVGIHHAFGCTKFSDALIASTPDIWTQMQSTSWNVLDAQFCTLARQYGNFGFVPHPHRPPVIHLKGLNL